MDITPTVLPDIKIYRPKRFSDARGCFTEWYNARTFAATQPLCHFVQDNLAFSAAAGTLRGLHFQKPPHAQGKLVGVLHGAIFDVAVDIRRGSPTYGRHVAAELNADLGNLLYVPPGFAHGYCTIGPDTLVIYKATEFWHRESEGGIVWDDPDLAIAWPLASAPQLVERDARLPRLAEVDPSPFPYEGSR
jgi:dTDP-4-dehydrorhamnose 3,5-epimerase